MNFCLKCGKKIKKKFVLCDKCASSKRNVSRGVVSKKEMKNLKAMEKYFNLKGV